MAGELFEGVSEPCGSKQRESGVQRAQLPHGIQGFSQRPRIWLLPCCPICKPKNFSSTENGVRCASAAFCQMRRLKQCLRRWS